MIGQLFKWRPNPSMNPESLDRIREKLQKAIDNLRNRGSALAEHQYGMPPSYRDSFIRDYVQKYDDEAMFIMYSVKNEHWSKLDKYLSKDEIELLNTDSPSELYRSLHR